MAVGSVVGSGGEVGSCVGAGTCVNSGDGVTVGETVTSEVGSGPGAPIVAEGVAVGTAVAAIVLVADGVAEGTGSTKGVAVGADPWPKGRGVGIGAKISGDMVGGVPPSAGPAQATAATSITGMLATAIRLTIDFIPGHLSEHSRRWEQACGTCGVRAHAFSCFVNRASVACVHSLQNGTVRTLTSG